MKKKYDGKVEVETGISGMERLNPKAIHLIDLF